MKIHRSLLSPRVFISSLIFNYRSKGITIHSKSVSLKANLSDRVVIHRDVLIKEFVSIGNDSYINEGAKIINADIGAYCSIGYNAIVGPEEHKLDDISTSPNISNSVSQRKAIISNNVWIGCNSIILSGVSIGTGAVVAAGAIVTKDMPPYSICLGSPAKIIRFRFDINKIDKISSINWNQLPNVMLEEIRDYD